MKNFVLLYGGEPMQGDQAEQEKVMKAWMAWYEDLGDILVDAGGPFTPQAKTILDDGSINDGQHATSAHGYSIVRADSLDEAVTLAKGCPLSDGQYISVIETFAVM